MRRWRKAPPAATLRSRASTRPVPARREPVGVGHHSQPGEGVETAPTGPGGVFGSVDGNGHERQPRQVVEPASGRGEVEVEEGHGLAVSEHHVLGTDVVVTDHVTRAGTERVGVGHLRAPGRAVGSDEADGGVVEPAQQTHRRSEHASVV